MEPVEINAGAWYLRAPRADEKMDDRPALTAMGETDPDYVFGCTAGWASDTVYRWAVCEPTTGEMVAEVTLNRRNGMLHSRAREGHADAAASAEAAARRFADAMLT